MGKGEFSFPDSPNDRQHGRKEPKANGIEQRSEENCEPKDQVSDLEEDDEDDYYAILGISSDATDNQIRAAYHSSSRRFHPDKQLPEMRERATLQFNRILVAYETLRNPHRRIVYDKLGIEGLKNDAWKVGVRAMGPEQFRYWLEEAMRKQKEEMLEEMVGSTGKITAKIDMTGLRYAGVFYHKDENGSVVKEEVRPLPVGVLTKYHLKHAFRIPLDFVGELLERPFPRSVSQIWNINSPQPKKGYSTTSKPTLSLECSLGGSRIQTSGKTMNHVPGMVLAAPGLTATISHGFPNLPPEADRSLATLLAGNNLSVSATALPSQMVTATFARGFGQNALTMRSTFFTLPHKRPPLIECSLVRRLSLRHSMIVALNTGGAALPNSLWGLFKLPALGQVRTGFASLGYQYHPLPTGINEENDEGKDSLKRKPPISRSKRSESYNISLTAGLLANGVQAKFGWGRTYYLATPLNKQLQPHKQRSNIGIRLAVEATFHITGAAQWTVKATRKIFEHTAMGMNVSVGGPTGSDGVVVGLSWSRLGQNISIPFVVAPLRDPKVVLYATAVPFFTYVAAEILWLRPRERRIRDTEIARLKKAMRSRTLKKKKAAEEVMQLLRVFVERKMQAEKTTGGLVILKATYGKDSSIVDVTIAIAAMVEQGQLSVPRGIDKSKLVGFYDPVPGVSDKVLTVRYLHRGLEHEVTVKGTHGLVAPMRSHIIPGQT